MVQALNGNQTGAESYRSTRDGNHSDQEVHRAIDLHMMGITQRGIEQ